jgi:hypothetical protein
MNDTSVKQGDCLGMGINGRERVKGRVNMIEVLHTYVWK